jgi:hypothetical protein
MWACEDRTYILNIIIWQQSNSDNFNKLYTGWWGIHHTVTGNKVYHTNHTIAIYTKYLYTSEN